MTVTPEKLILIVLAGLIIMVVIYFEGNGFEIHRFIVGLIGICEGVIIAQGLGRQDKFATLRNWTTKKKLSRKALLCFGVIIIIVTIDRLVNYTLKLYDKDYNIIWTIVIPGTIVLAQLLKMLDIWAVENEK